MANSVVLRDFEELARRRDWSGFVGKRILITGATGLIGSLTARFLLYLNRKNDLNATVFAVVRNPEKAKAVFEGWESDALKLIEMDLMGDGHADMPAVDFIVHAAAITTSKTMISNPVETLMTAISSTRKMLDLATAQQASMVYISSMEVYGTVSVEGMVDEKQLGYIDLSNVRSCYPEGKRACECLCRAYAAQHGTRVISARLAQTFGAGILPGENRVFAQFARSAMRGTPIVLHTLGKSEGNYVYTTDAVHAILLMLLEGASGEAYNVSNEKSHMTIAEMAHLVADVIGGGKCQVVFDIPEDAAAYGYAADTKLHMSAGKLSALGWQAQVDLAEAYRRLAEYLREENS